MAVSAPIENPTLFLAARVFTPEINPENWYRRETYFTEMISVLSTVCEEGSKDGKTSQQQNSTDDNFGVDRKKRHIQGFSLSSRGQVKKRSRNDE